jgi:hypothetical protein
MRLRTAARPHLLGRFCATRTGGVIAAVALVREIRAQSAALSISPPALQLEPADAAKLANLPGTR